MTDVIDLAPDRLELGEGSRWAGNHLVLVDIPAGRLLAAPAPTGATPTSANPLTELAKLSVPLAAVAPVADRPDVWLAAAGTGFAVLDGADVRWVGVPQPVTDRPWRMNDAFSADGRVMYLSDTPLGHVDRFDVDPRTGDLSGRRPFARIKEENGSPDGLTVDADDHVWVALFGGSAVHRYRPDGILDRRLAMPARQPTSVCLVGDRVVVTSGRGGLTDPGDRDGAVLVAAAGATGRPALPARLDATVS